MRAIRSRQGRGGAYWSTETRRFCIAETVLAGLPAWLRLQLSHEKDGLKQPYEMRMNREISANIQRNATIKSGEIVDDVLSQIGSYKVGEGTQIKLAWRN